MNFVKTKRASVQLENPTADFSDMGKIMGSLWRSFTQDKKDSFIPE
jgi:hypothetical protein